MAQKDIQYATLNTRLIATTIDMLILAIILWIAKLITLPYTAQYYINQEEILNQLGLIAIDHPEILDSTSASLMVIYDQFTSNPMFLSHIFLAFIAPSIISIILIIFCWSKYSATPGKMILKLRIVDENSLKQPTLKQFIIRILGYIINCILLGVPIFIISLNKRHKGMQDYMANTLVIKRH